MRAHFFITLTFILILSWHQNTFSQAQTSGQKVTEVAIYRIKEQKLSRFPKLLSDFRSQVSKLKGYNTYQTLRKYDQSVIFIDILHWDDLQAALTASEQVQIQDRYQPFVSAIDSLIAYGDFFPYKHFINPNKSHKMHSTVTEIVVYQLKPDKIATYRTIATETDTFLKTQPGFISRKILQNYQDHSIFIDIAEWETLEQAQTAAKIAEQTPALIPFFEAIDTIITSGHYEFYQ